MGQIDAMINTWSGKKRSYKDSCYIKINLKFKNNYNLLGASVNVTHEL